MKFWMSYNIIASERFIKDLKALSRKYPSIKQDLQLLQKELLLNPTLGSPLAKNCFKVRFAISSKGKGKSGGGRLITCIRIVKKNIHLITVYDKSERETITDEALVELLKQEGLLWNSP